MVPVLVARTFPRVAFTFWGGMRFALGLLAIACAVRFFQGRKFGWLFLSGILAACALLTSVEIGVCAGFGVIAAVVFALIFHMLDFPSAKKAFLVFLGGGLLVAGPFALYLIVNQAFIPYLDNVWTVVTRMEDTFNLNFTMEIPNTFPEALAAMLNPVSTNFKQMTPAYFYIVLFVYIVWKIRQKKLDSTDLAVVCLGAYGFLLYVTAFRHIWAYQFEMALQPEKVLLFFILEQVYLKLREKRIEFSVVGVPSSGADMGKYTRRWLKIGLVNFLILGLVGSSLGYSLARYGKRFVAFKYLTHFLSGKGTASLHPLYGKDYRPIKAERADGMAAPAEQAQEIEKLAEFFDNNTQLGETVFIFPELGFYSFIIDRPFVGRFPMVTMAWFKEEWHAEFMADLKKEMPRFAIIDKDPGPAFPAIFFQLERNKKKYDEVLNLIKKNYAVVDETPGVWIYKRKK